MELNVRLNDEKNGVELHFGEQPSEILSKRIETLGFKHCYDSFLKWYAPQHPALVEYARALEKALFEGKDVLSIPLQPSFEPSEANIWANKFSYVIILFDRDGQTKRDHYVVFDSYKRVATDIATRFGREKYKEAFKGVEVYARNHKVKASLLMELEKVIPRTKDRQTSMAIENPSSLDKQHIPEITHKITEDFFDKTEAASGTLKETVPAMDITKRSEDKEKTRYSPMPILRYDSKPGANGTMKKPVDHITSSNGDGNNTHRHIVKPATEDQEPETPEHNAVSPVDLKEDYLDRLYGNLYLMYADQKRPTNEQIRELGQQLGISDKEMLWDGVELSSLLWHRQIYQDLLPFDMRLEKMIRFWIHQEPTYTHRDDETLYRKYATPCPIAAMIAQYTEMDKAESIFDPSAGNGMLLVGADPRKTHANEIDPVRLDSLKYQRFAKITSYDATEPFDYSMTKAYDVVVTNPPNIRWEEGKTSREDMLEKYFKNSIARVREIRPEHLMAAMALHCMKDQGKATIIITGHIHFSEEGRIARYRSFFNWLYRHYLVSDIINLNSFNFYNKQGDIKKTMLILVNGRKLTPGGAAPQQHEAPHLPGMISGFDELWKRIKSHTGYTIDLLIKQLKIELEGQGISVNDQ